MSLGYDLLFQRNYGIFTPAEQERMARTKVLIIGCGGAGGVVAMILARTGFNNLILMEPDCYEPTNMNRQIACFADTIGTNKAEVLKESILRINPSAQVTVCARALQPGEIEEVAKEADVIVPVADDWALSLTAFDVVNRVGKPAVMGYPVGAIGRAGVFLPGRPPATACVGMPSGLSYDELKQYADNPDCRRLVQYYRTHASWREDWFERWTRRELPHAQICPIVWVTSCLTALEVIKLASGKWQPVISPRYWYITPDGARIRTISLARRFLSWISGRPWMKERIAWLSRRERLLRLFTRAIA